MPPRISNPFSYLPRRLQIVVTLAVLILVSILFLGGSSPADPILDYVPYGPQLEHGAHSVLEHVPYAERLNPFAVPIHKPPPEQKNSSSGDVRWFSDFKWRNPFSSSTTFDEDRAVLPPLRERPRVYTYFDSSRRKDERSRQAEHDLLEIWRRAWWAQGFSPIVLGQAEATNNPLYRRVQELKLTPELQLEIMRWLAWGNMGTGIMCNWLAMPMASYNDPLLSFLRRGEFPVLTRYDGLENGLFVGMKNDIDQAMNTVIVSPNVSEARSIYEAVPEEMFLVDPNHSGIAFYSSSIIASKYAAIKSSLDGAETRALGLTSLATLINSHLHMTWQTLYSSGIAVLKPLAQNTTSMVEPALELARNLSRCAETPFPTSCPPNNGGCKPCSNSQPMRILTPPTFKNSSTLFTIGTVPHPYTLQALIHTNPSLDLYFIRRKTNRDEWITAATRDLLGAGASAGARLAPLKEAIASDYGAAHSYWFTAENPFQAESEKDLEELDYIFGFKIPREIVEPGKSKVSGSGSEQHPAAPLMQESDAQSADPDLVKLQLSLLERSRRAVRNGEKSSKDKAAIRTRNIIEAWNLADTEAWKFVRAWNARRRLERRSWENEEGRFLGKGMYERFKDFVHA